jgi:hypothetical protein
MRPSILAVAAALLLACAPASLAAPTCQTRDGDGVRCGTPGAMPVGWIPAPDQPLARRAPPPASALLGLVAVVGGFFALIALMPDFQGRPAGDWDAQEDDEDERG